MARFKGVVQGVRGPTTRLGTNNSGLTTIAGSWSGAVRTDLYVNSEGIDCARISLTLWEGKGTKRLIYDGPVNPGESDAL